MSDNKTYSEIMKKLIKNIINKFGYEIKRLNPEFKQINFDDLIKEKICKNPVIFDVGGNKGQSIERYIKIFNKPTIHSFEPINSEFNFMNEKFKNNKNIFLNNYALGDKTCKQKLNVTAITGNSSFNKIRPGTKWLKTRSYQSNTSSKTYVKSIQEVDVKKLDDYVEINNINKIDLLKIDTQGYEDKILKGSQKTIKGNKVKVIMTEIMFDNVYNKHFSFSDIEKFIIPNNFRMIGIDLPVNNLFSGLFFFADVYYFNKKYFNI